MNLMSLEKDKNARFISICGVFCSSVTVRVSHAGRNDRSYGKDS